MFQRRAASFLPIGLALTALLRAQENLEIPNWSAPPFWSAPVKWEKGGEAEPLSVEGSAADPSPFVAVPPCRIADTRGNGFTGQAGPPTILANTLRTFQVTGTVPGVTTQCGILPGAIAVSFQFTVTSMTSGGNLIAWPSGPAPTTSVLNWNASSVAIGSGTVVQVSGTGALNVQVNAPIGQAANLIIDVNGFYLPGGLDGFYVNEGQTSSISSSMIADGAIVNVDINAAAAIADTKLATIATAGKVADTALSANVTKLGDTIEANEITNITRSVSIPLATFIDCQTDIFAPLDFINGTDPIANLTSAATDGAGTAIQFDTTPGTEDQNSEICSQLSVPADYASGGSLRVRTQKGGHSGATEVLNCAAQINGGSIQAAGTVEITSISTASLVCTPTIAALAPGDSLAFHLSITSSGTMDDFVVIRSVAFEYTASQ